MGSADDLEERDVPAIELEGVETSFGKQQVLRGVELRIPVGTTYVLLGRSGAGKTVLLKHVAGLLHPDRGHVRIQGADLATLTPDQLQSVRARIGVVFQAGALFDSLTVFDNVAFPLRQGTKLKEFEIGHRVREKLSLLSLVGVEQRFPSELSGGMRKRVALARAIVHEPVVLLVDDPTAGLDPVLSHQVASALLALREKLSVTSLLITNELPVAFQLADRMGLLDEGQIVAEGTPAEFRQSQHPAVRAYLSSWIRRNHPSASLESVIG